LRALTLLFGTCRIEMIESILLLVLSDLDTAARLYDKLFERYRQREATTLD